MNAKYSEADSGEIQPYIVMPRWLRKVLNIVCADALGGLAGSWGGVAGATIGAIISSVSAGACLDTDGKFLASETVWPTAVNTYLSSFNPDICDEAGKTHNRIIINLLKNYGKSSLQNMSENELYNAVINEYVKGGNPLPSNYNPQYYYTQTMSSVNYIIQTDNYARVLDYWSLSTPTLRNQCTLLKQYLNAMETISESECLPYHLEFRNKVVNSSIPLTAKNNIRLCTSIGLGSAHLWKAVE